MGIRQPPGYREAAWQVDSRTTKSGAQERGSVGKTGDVDAASVAGKAPQFSRPLPRDQEQGQEQGASCMPEWVLLVGKTSSDGPGEEGKRIKRKC